MESIATCMCTLFTTGRGHRLTLAVLKQFNSDVSAPIRVPSSGNGGKVMIQGPLPETSWNGIVYKIPCKDCPKLYIGQSKRSLKCRLKEHERAVQNADYNVSALAEHCWEKGHPS